MKIPYPEIGIAAAILNTVVFIIIWTKFVFWDMSAILFNPITITIVGG